MTRLFATLAKVEVRSLTNGISSESVKDERFTSTSETGGKGLALTLVGVGGANRYATALKLPTALAGNADGSLSKSLTRP